MGGTCQAPEGQGRGAPVSVHPGKREHIKDSKTAADSSLAIAEWVPGETDPRLEVVKGLVRRPEVLNRSLGGAGDGFQNGERIMSFGRQRHRLVTDAKVQRDVGAPTPIVLKVGSE